MRTSIFALLFGLFMVLGTTFLACEHQPLTPIEPNPTDSTTTVGNPCSPDSVYFALQVLPILQSNCAMSGCHDAITAEDGVVLTDYNNVMQTGEIVAFSPNNSELYEVITENDPDKIMPPPPASPLTADQIALIKKWINQGALDLSCTIINCDTTDVSFATTVYPILTQKCLGCHKSPAPSGGIDLEGYANVKTYADNGYLYGVIAHLNGYSAMPKNGNQLPDCEIRQIEAWISAGAKNN